MGQPAWEQREEVKKQKVGQPPSKSEA